LIEQVTKQNKKAAAKWQPLNLLNRMVKD